MSSLAEYRIAFGEEFRFEMIISTLKLPELNNAVVGDASPADEFGYGYEESDIWEARNAAMLLLNAIATATGSVEDRIMLREEYGRRGLNEAIVVSSGCSACRLCSRSDRSCLPQPGSSLSRSSRRPSQTTRLLHRRKV